MVVQPFPLAKSVQIAGTMKSVLQFKMGKKNTVLIPVPIGYVVPTPSVSLTTTT